MADAVQIVSADFLRGLLDTQDETGLETGFSKFQNLRVGRGRGENRKGMVWLATPGKTDQAKATLDGAADYYEIPLRASFHRLPTTFALETVFKPATVSGTDYLLGVKHANYGLKIRRNATTMEVLIHDGTNSATHDAGTVAAATLYGLRLEYDGETLTTYLQTIALAASAATETGTVVGQLRAPGGDLLIGADAATPASFWEGDIEYLRAFSKLAPDQDMRYLFSYWPHPKGQYVLFDYIPGILDADDQLIDHSRNLNTGRVQGSPTVGTSLLDPCDPVQAIATRVDLDNQPRLVVVSGGVPIQEAV